MKKIFLILLGLVSILADAQPKASGTFAKPPVYLTTTLPLRGGGSLSTNKTLTIDKASASSDGYLASSDFAKISNFDSTLKYKQRAFAKVGTSAATNNDNILLTDDKYTLSKVGIGTASPQQNLHTKSTTNKAAIRIETTGDVVASFGNTANVEYFDGTGYAGNVGFDGSKQFTVINNKNTNIDFYTGGFVRATLLPNGKFGIGTNSPTKTLDVRGSAYVRDSLYLPNTPNGFLKTTGGLVGVSGISKADVGLGNVDNTSDLNKPVSTAMQTALNGIDASNDAWLNNATNARVQLATNADGVTARTLGAEVMVTDYGQIILGSQPSDTYPTEVAFYSNVGRNTYPTRSYTHRTALEQRLDGSTGATLLRSSLFFNSTDQSVFQIQAQYNGSSWFEDMQFFYRNGTTYTQQGQISLANNSYINTNGGNFGIGKTTPLEKLDVAGSIKLAGTYTAISNNATTPVPAGGAGTMTYQTTDNHFYGWNGSAWKQLD